MSKDAANQSLTCLPQIVDVGSCTEGSNKPAKAHTRFEYTSHPNYRSPIAGEISFIAGHLHDGGTHLTVKRNRRDVLCDSVASYGDKGDCASYAFSETVHRNGHGHDHGHGEDVHVSGLSTCTNLGRVEVGDKLGVTAYYDTTLHEPMEAHDGELEPVMGIAIMYVACEDVVGGLQASEGDDDEGSRQKLVIQDQS